MVKGYVIGFSSGMFMTASQEEKEQFLTMPRKFFKGAIEGVNFTQVDIESITEFKEPFLKEGIERMKKLGLGLGFHGESYAMYAILQFLQAGNTAYFVRLAPDFAKYSAGYIGRSNKPNLPMDGTHSQSTAGIDVSARSGVTTVNGQNRAFQVIAKTPGSTGDQIEIAIINKFDYDRYIDFILDGDTEGFFFENPPEAQEEFILAVWDNAAQQYVESWTVSRISSKRDARRKSMYLETVVNQNSNWIRVVDNDNLDSTTQIMSTLGLRIRDNLYIERDPVGDQTNGDSTAITRVVLGGGADGTATSNISDGQILNGWEEFRNPEELDVNILVHAGGGDDFRTISDRLLEIAQSRADCIAISDAPFWTNTPLSVVNWKRKQWNPNSSYGALYWPWVQVYDRYTDQELWLPPTVYAAYVYALTDFTREPWFAPAGLNRGIINVLDLQYKPTQGDRDILYTNNINPIAFFPGEGTAFWGQKTLQRKASALDRVNVRRLFLVLEKAIAKAAKYLLFEPNDRFTRRQLVMMIDPFLRDVQARRGIESFRVICNESNNPAQVIDRNEMICDIYIQPIKAAEFITLKFNILRTGVLAEELV